MDLADAKRRKLEPEQFKSEADIPDLYEVYSTDWFNALTRAQRAQFLENDFYPDAKRYVDRIKVRGGAFAIFCVYLEQLLFENAGTSGNLTPGHFKGKFLEDVGSGEDALREKQICVIQEWPDGAGRVELKKQEIIKVSVEMFYGIFV